ncbi:uncharacterized protein LOC123273784 [Cotesia glomerata]|uniref:uncharacterized protein LOC123273784 n=1 Tax=Cotesia glomerata TaxID=32391 RepID=UPI001D034B9A|nr:uncharacterized protein LOC123273784 [Cotesia glomerata]
MSLYIKNTNLQHNHERIKELYHHLPQVRKMTPKLKQKVKGLLKLKANKTRIQDLISKETGKVVLLKDIHNLNYTGEEKNKLEVVKNILVNEYKADCHFLIEDNVFKGLFFATPQMKSAMKSYPEYIGIDATFKLLNIRAPVYLIIVEDSNGCTEIVGVSILITENKCFIKWMMDSFKKCHPSWEKIQCIMTDKDMTERAAIQESLLPLKVNLIMCAFHTLKTFNREITTDKRGITQQERDESKRILQQMVYAESEERYLELYEELQKMPPSAVEYFNENWHESRKEWSISTDFVQHNFGNGTNNRVESLNAKLKDLDIYSSLEDFTKNF